MSSVSNSPRRPSRSEPESTSDLTAEIAQGNPGYPAVDSQVDTDAPLAVKRESGVEQTVHRASVVNLFDGVSAVLNGLPDLGDADQPTASQSNPSGGDIGREHVPAEVDLAAGLQLSDQDEQSSETDQADSYNPKKALALLQAQVLGLTNDLQSLLVTSNRTGLSQTGDPVANTGDAVSAEDDEKQQLADDLADLIVGNGPSVSPIQNDQIEQQNQQLRLQLQQAEQALAVSQENQASIAGELALSQQSQATIATELAAAQQKFNSEQRQQSEALQQQISQLTTEHDRSHQEIADLGQRLADASGHLDQSEQQLETSHQQRHQLVAELETLKHQASSNDQQATITRLENELANVQQALKDQDELTDQLATAESERIVLSAQNRRLIEDAAALAPLLKTQRQLEQHLFDRSARLNTVVRATVQMNQDEQRAGDRIKRAKIQVEDADRAVNTAVQRTQQTSDAISEMATTCQQIKALTRDIKQIAIQSNMVALNASVEANRAGESGRGFKQVADEVRKLSRRCTSVETEINQLITVSIERTEQCSDSFDQAGGDYEQAIQQLARLGRFVSWSGDSNNTQLVGLEQLVDGLKQIQQPTSAEQALLSELKLASKQMQNNARQARLYGGDQCSD